MASSTMRSLAALLALAAGLVSGLGATDTITWGGDNSRTGYQTTHNMDPAVVASSQFAQIFRATLPGNYLGKPEQIYSQPLVYTPMNGTKQYVYWLTSQNNVYKMDPQTGEILLSKNFAIPFQQADLSGCPDMQPYIGITGTAVIDPDTDTIYFATKTYANQSDFTPQGRPAGRYYIHAVDVNDFSERPNFPIDLEGLVPTNSPTRSFNGGIQLQRPGLLHAGNFIYAGFGSHCVQYNFTGWVIGWDKTTGQLVEHWATEGEGVDNQTPGGSLWMSGGGIASDDAGSIYFATGNGYASQLSTIPVNGHNPPTALEEAACHMSINDDGSLTLVDFFMPQDKQILDEDDKDLGVSPLELLPSQFSCGAYKHIGVVTDKNGVTYFLNLDDLGGYRMGPDSTDEIIGSYANAGAVYAGAGVYPLEGPYIYINVIGAPTIVFQFSCNNGVPEFTPVAKTVEINADDRGVSHGTVTTLNGEVGTGLLWVTDIQGSSDDMNLRIYDAVPQNGVLKLINAFNPQGINKFTRPVFGDGILYLGTDQGWVFGFGAPFTPPLNCTSPNNFGSVNIGNSSEAVTITCTAVIGVTVKSASVKSTQYALSGMPSLPLTLAKGQSFQFKTKFSPVAVGLDSTSVIIDTTNNVAGYSMTTSPMLNGTAVSLTPLLEISPTNLTFSEVTTGVAIGGVNESAIFSNIGETTLVVSDYAVSATGKEGTFVPGTTVGLFTFLDLPSEIAPNTEAAIIVNFNSIENGTFSGYLQINSTGGLSVLEVYAVSGGPPVTLIQFMTPDGTGWVDFNPQANFTFGNVTENTSRNLVLRVSNIAPPGSNVLTITVSKPPFGIINSIIGSQNDVDLAEGNIIQPGESENATLFCSVPKTQWDTNSYTQYQTWIFNDNDNDFGKKAMGFVCEAVAEQTAPLDSSGESIYRYVGCFKDNNPNRQLSRQLYSMANSTNAMCIAACSAAGYTFCGTEYQVECWAGNVLPVQQVDDGNCNYACGGNLNQICGGNGVGADAGGSFISLFANSLQWNGTTSTSPPSGPFVNPGIDGYASIGCWHEPPNGRALANQESTALQTVDDCLKACAGKYTYAGLEYGGECWCDNSLASAAYQVGIANCSMPCNNNGTEYCGGPVLLNIYQLNGTSEPPPPPASSVASKTTSASLGGSTPTGGPYVNPGVDGFVSIGCYHEPASGRALTFEFDTTSETVAQCLNICAGKYTYAGLEYGGECWCDNTINSQAYSVALSQCTQLCNGNSSEYCGGSLLLNVYQMSGILPSNLTSSTIVHTSSTTFVNTTPVSTTPASTTPASTTSASTTSASTTPSVSSTAPGGPSLNPGTDTFVSIGCYTEGTSTRALENGISNPANTVAGCLSACAGKYIYAGLEYGGQCWCGDTLGAGSVSTSVSACSMPCTGNSTELCGGSSVLNMYQSNATGLPAGGPFINPGIDGYGYLGCYIEPSGGRALPNAVSTTNQTVADCLDACSSTYTYAGLEYGGQCWCANAITPGTNLTSSGACNMLCNNNQTEFCGGSSLLTIYEKDHSGLDGIGMSPSSTSSSSTSTAVSSSSTLSSTSSSISSSTSSSISSSISSSTTSSISPSTTSIESTGSIGPASTSATTTLSTPTISTAQSSITATATNGYYFIGCFEDNASGHVLPQLFSNNSVTPELCINYANSIYSKETATTRMPYVYVEYHNQCYGGASLSFAGSAVTSLVGTKACTDVCSGSIATVTTNGKTAVTTNTANYCGGARQFNLYALSPSVSLPTSSGPVVTSTAT